jgi:hypothetical protein
VSNRLGRTHASRTQGRQAFALGGEAVGLVFRVRFQEPLAAAAQANAVAVVDAAAGNRRRTLNSELSLK